MSQPNSNIAPFHSTVFPTVTSVKELLEALSNQVLSLQVPTSPVAFTQTYATAAATVPDATVAAVVTTGATNTVPYGYSGAAQADAIPVAINALTADVLALRKVVTQIIDILQAAGLAA